MQQKKMELENKQWNGIFWNLGMGVLIVLFFTIQIYIFPMLPGLQGGHEQELAKKLETVEERKRTPISGLGEYGDFSAIVVNWLEKDRVETAQNR